MKRSITQRVIRYSAGFVVGVLGLVLGVRQLWAPRHVTFWLDPRFSHEMQHVIRTTFTPTTVHGVTSQSLAGLLGPVAPTVARARVRYVGANTAYVQIDSVHPFVLINHKFVFSKKEGAEAGVWGAREFFKDEIIDRLPQVTVLDKQINNERVKKELFSFLVALPTDFFDRYEIVWYDKTRIDLIDREQPDVTIGAWHRTRFDEKLRAVITTLQQKIEEKRVGKKGSVKNQRDAWRIDVRMGGQAVLCQERLSRMQGGMYETTTRGTSDSDRN